MARPAAFLRSWRRRTLCGALLILATAVLVAGPAGVSPSLAQLFIFPPRPKPIPKPDRAQDQMLVRAEEIKTSWGEHGDRVRLVEREAFLLQQLYGTVQVNEFTLRQIWPTGHAAGKVIDA